MFSSNTLQLHRAGRGPGRPFRFRRFVRLQALIGGLLLLAGGERAAAESVLLEAGWPMTYLANGSDPGIDANWFQHDFSEGPEWTVGAFGVGHEFIPAGPNAHDLIQTAVPVQVASIYTRATFNVGQASSVFSLHLGADYDDGFVAWINGVEVSRSPELRNQLLVWNTVSLNHESSNAPQPVYEPLRDISEVGIPLLQDGDNVLAVGVWNVTAASEDLVLVPKLVINKMLTRAPYLQQTTPSSAIVRWRTGEPADSRVLLGLAPGALSSEVLVPGPTTDHTVPLSGLMPNTRYYYAVATAVDILAGADTDHFFDTAPEAGTPKPMRLWVLGDSGQGNGPAVAVRDAYYDFAADVANGGADARDTDLILMLGDNAYPTGTQLEYQYNLFDIFSDQLTKSVLWAAIGNHDGFDGAAQTWPYYDIFTFPEQAEAGGVATSTEKYYSFDYGNAHFVVLNSMEITSGVFGAEMLTWLETDLADVTEDWIVALFHHPPYSKGSHDSDDPSDSQGRLIWMRENAVPILEDYGVDLVLTGHSHSYERSYLLDGHYGDSTTFLEGMKLDPGDGNEAGDGAYVKPSRSDVPYSGVGDGAVYTVSGSASSLSPGAAEALGGTEPSHPAMVLSLYQVGSLVLDIDGNRLDGRFLDDGGAFGDEFTIFKDAITVAPEAAFGATPRVGSAPATIDFFDLTANGPTAWAWDFDDDGTPDSNAPAPSVQFVETGLHSIRLDVSNSVGADTVQKSNYICIVSGSPEPVADLVFEEDHQTFGWSPAAHATAYDVIRGNLTALVAGNLPGLDLSCLEDDDTDLWAEDASPPASGEVLFYLAGGVNCAGQQGTFETPGSVPRDATLHSVCESCATGADDDADEICAADDNCPDLPNADQLDVDGDGAGDVCDGCPMDEDKTQPGLCGCGVPDTDADADQTPDCLDGCPTDPGKTDPGQCGCGEPDTDSDNDQAADCVDLCPDDPGKIEPGLCGCGVADTDTDNDATPDCLDLCPTDPDKVDPGQCGCDVPDTDGDGDRTADCVDGCPADPLKTDPGQCGCGMPDTDTDDDRTADCNDLCPTDPDKTDPGQCGCGVPDFDSDFDGTPDCLDGCPNDPFKTAPGLCGCGVPDDDSDDDGTEDCHDGCPNDPLKVVPGQCGCGIPDTDSDADGAADCRDDCPTDPDKTEAGLCGCFVYECWALQTAPTTEDLESLHFPEDDEAGYAVGRKGTILKTTDGGSSWIALNSTTSIDLETIHCPVDDSTCFVVGHLGRVLRTTSAGQSWFPLPVGVNVDLRGVYFLNDSVGFVVGDSGTIRRTSNGGLSWAAQPSGTIEDLESVEFPGNGPVGYVAGGNGTVLKTINGGAQWVTLPVPTGADLEDVHFPANISIGFVAGDSGTLLKTTNGGLSWVPQPLLVFSTLRGISFPLDALTGRVVGSNGLIRWTGNGGQTWAPDLSPIGETLRDVQFPVDHEVGYAVGSGGVILKRVIE